LDSIGGTSEVGVRAGKIDEVGLGNGDIIDSAAGGAATGRIGGGIPGGRLIGETAFI
jgi:hypothetical protein